MPNPLVCIRTHTKDHVRTLKIMSSMSEFGGLWKHENNQHALYPRRRNVAAQVDGGIKNGHIRYPSYRGTQKKREKNRYNCLSVLGSVQSSGEPNESGRRRPTIVEEVLAMRRTCDIAAYLHGHVLRAGCGAISNDAFNRGMHDVVP